MAFARFFVNFERSHSQSHRQAYNLGPDFDIGDFCKLLYYKT